MVGEDLRNVTLNLISAGVGYLLRAVPQWTAMAWKWWSSRQQFVGPGKTKFKVFLSTPNLANDDYDKARHADVLTFISMRDTFRNRIPDDYSKNVPKTWPPNPSLIIGSIRYNPLAKKLQGNIEAPFQFVLTSPELDDKHALLAIYDAHGCEFCSSADPVHGELEGTGVSTLTKTEHDYGLLLVGDFEDSETGVHRVVWLAGIHGIGTLGVMKWLVQHIQHYDWHALGNTCFLIRTAYDVNELQRIGQDREFERLENAVPVLVSGPSTWKIRDKHTEPLGILCDMGGVLLPFDRRRFEHNLLRFFGIALNDKQRREIERERLRAEGFVEDDRIDYNEFLAKLLSITLGSRPDRSLERVQLAAAWSDIFWRNEREIALLAKVAKRPDIKLVLVSNTDPVRLEHALEYLNLKALFTNDRVVASFSPEVRPKGKDHSMVAKGVEILNSQFGGRRHRTVFVDDVRNYLAAARSHDANIDVIHYRNYPKLVLDFRRLGIDDS